MSLFRKRARPGPSSHPDPVIELKLRNIAAIDGLRASVMRQIGDYQASIVGAQSLMQHSVSHHGVKSAASMEPMLAERIARAEEGIQQQREVILGLNERLNKAITDSGLTESDLSYLNLES